jgi:hypothetical protein
MVTLVGYAAVRRNHVLISNQPDPQNRSSEMLKGCRLDSNRKIGRPPRRTRQGALIPLVNSLSDNSESFFAIGPEEDAWRNQRRAMQETGVDRARCLEMY